MEIKDAFDLNLNQQMRSYDITLDNKYSPRSSNTTKVAGRYQFSALRNSVNLKRLNPIRNSKNQVFKKNKLNKTMMFQKLNSTQDKYSNRVSPCVSPHKTPTNMAKLDSFMPV